MRSQGRGFFGAFMVALMAVSLVLGACGGKPVDPCELTQNAVGQTVTAVEKSEAAVQELSKGISANRHEKSRAAKSAVANAEQAAREARASVGKAFGVAPDCAPEATHVVADAQNLVAQNDHTVSALRDSYEQATHTHRYDDDNDGITDRRVDHYNNDVSGAKDELSAAQNSSKESLARVGALQQAAARLPASAQKSR